MASLLLLGSLHWHARALLGSLSPRLLLPLPICLSSTGPCWAHSSVQAARSATSNAAPTRRRKDPISAQDAPAAAAAGRDDDDSAVSSSLHADVTWQQLAEPQQQQKRRKKPSTQQQQQQQQQKAAGIVHDSDIADTVGFACSVLKRQAGPEERALVARLRENWYTTAGSLAGMTQAELQSMQVPMRMWTEVVRTLGLPGSPGEQQLQQHKQQRKQSRPQPSEEQQQQQPQQQKEQRRHRKAEPTAATGLATSPDVQTAGKSDNIAKRRAPPPATDVVRPPNAKPPNTAKHRGVYGLLDSELTDAQREELAAFRTFWTTSWPGQQHAPMRESSCDVLVSRCKMMLGWLHHQRDMPLEEVCLRAMVPSTERQGADMAYAFMGFLAKERGVAAGGQERMAHALMNVAKFVHHEASSARSDEGDRPYSDLPVMRTLRKLLVATAKASKVAPHVADEAQKWMDWDEFLGCLGTLKAECGALDHTGQPRKPIDVAQSLQVYLIWAILSCVPDRQRTLRELEVGRTLFKEGDRWLIRHNAADYKTGGSYGVRPPMLIAPFVYPELEAFINTYRAALNPSHNRLFSKKRGAAIDTPWLWALFRNTAMRLTGKSTNPHLVRDMIVTYLKGKGATEAELEALALYMGHSITMQRSSYDRRTKEAKVGPAVELLMALANGARSSQQGK